MQLHMLSEARKQEQQKTDGKNIEPIIERRKLIIVVLIMIVDLSFTEQLQHKCSQIYHCFLIFSIGSTSDCWLSLDCVFHGIGIDSGSI